jgi:allantoin racemase
MRIWHQSFTDLDQVPRYRETIARHARLVMPPHVEVVPHGLRRGTYGEGFTPIDTIRYRYLEFLNEAQICEAALTAERAGYDAVAVGCFYDPALRQARSLVEIPVVGLSETCMLVAMSLGKRFGLIALNDDQRLQHEELAAAYGLRERLAASLAIDPPVDEYLLEAVGPEARPLMDSFADACRRAIRAGAEVIIPGDGVLNEFLWRNEARHLDGATVMDSLGVLFHYAAFLAGARASMGLGVSRIHHYARPMGTMLSHARRMAGAQEIPEDAFSGIGGGAV